MDCRGCQKLTKCCAFQPFVPNFLLGGLLENENRFSLAQHKNLSFQPLGAMATVNYRAQHLDTKDRESEVSLLCSFYKNGGCSIWNFRPGECSTYFCDSGMKTEPRQGLARKAFDVEVAVAQMALVELGFSPRQISSQVDACNGAGDLAQNYSDDRLISMYKQAWNWSKSLTSDQVQSWLE